MNLPEWAHLEEEGHGKSAQIVMAVGEGEKEMHFLNLDDGDSRPQILTAAAASELILGFFI